MFIPEIVKFSLVGPWTERTDVTMSYVNSAAELGALAMGDRAVVAPMSNLVTEATYFPGGTVFIGVLRIVYSALTTVEPCQLHRRLRSGFLSWGRPHCYLVERWSLHSC